jgi:hypothetical protein
VATSERAEVKVLKHTMNAASPLAFQETPVHGDPDIRFVHPPGSVRMPELAAKPLAEPKTAVLIIGDANKSAIFN